MKKRRKARTQKEITEIFYTCLQKKGLFLSFFGGIFKKFFRFFCVVFGFLWII
jgi:hypothetical protein